MIYLLLLLWLVFAVRITQKKQQLTNRNVFIISYVLLTLLSALQYRIGADMPAYIGEYGYYNDDLSIDYLFSFHRRQPLWVLLNILCRRLSSDFVLLKIIQAVILNTCVFWFISKHTKHIMLGVLIYVICFYLHLNFNALRASLALSVFLLSYDSLVNKKLIKYYGLCFVAYFIHESSIILFLLPAIHLINPNKWNIRTTSIIVISIAVICLIGGALIQSQASTLLLQLQALGIISYGETYLENNYYSGFGLSVFGLGEFVLTFVLYIYILKKNIYEEKMVFSLLLIYIIIASLNIAFPIFYRFNDFFSIIYVCALTNSLVSFREKHYLPVISQNSILITIFVFIINTYPLFRTTAQYNAKPIIQFYPYYSVFEHKVSPDRERIFGYKENINYLY